MIKEFLEHVTNRSVTLHHEVEDNVLYPLLVCLSNLGYVITPAVPATGILTLAGLQNAE